MASTNATKMFIVRKPNQLLKAVREIGFENPRSVMKEVITKLDKAEERYGKKQIALRMFHHDTLGKRVELLHRKSEICVDYIQELTHNQELDRMVLQRTKEMEMLQNIASYTNQDDINEDIFFFFHPLHEYRNINWQEMMEQVSQWVSTQPDIRLTRDNIQEWNFNNQDYIRLTFTCKNMTRISPTEFALGRIVEGLTYVVKKQDWESHREQMFAILNS